MTARRRSHTDESTFDDLHHIAIHDRDGVGPASFHDPIDREIRAAVCTVLAAKRDDYVAIVEALFPQRGVQGDARKTALARWREAWQQIHDNDDAIIRAERESPLALDEEQRRQIELYERALGGQPVDDVYTFDAFGKRMPPLPRLTDARVAKQAQRIAEDRILKQEKRLKRLLTADEIAAIKAVSLTDAREWLEGLRRNGTLNSHRGRELNGRRGRPAVSHADKVERLVELLTKTPRCGAAAIARAAQMKKSEALRILRHLEKTNRIVNVGTKNRPQYEVAPPAQSVVRRRGKPS